MWFGDKKRVTLRENLTRYHEHLEAGSTGVLLPGVKTSTWGSQDTFGAVRFDCCGVTLDVVLKNLEIEGSKEDEAKRSAQLREDLKTTTKTVLTVGPRGGFRHLSISDNRGHPGIGFREKAERILAVLDEFGIAVERRTER